MSRDKWYKAPEVRVRRLESAVDPSSENYQAYIERQMGATMTEDNLSPDQKEVFLQVSKWLADPNKEQVLTVGGYAGTGKSTLLTVLANKFTQESIGFCTFTGKAAGVIRKKFRAMNVHNYDYVGTIHSMIYRPVTDGGRVYDWELVPTLPYTLIVVDEASMVSQDIFNDLLAFDIPILAVGDHGQLPPIGNDFNLMGRPALRLEKIHRQAEGSPIISFASFVRENKRLPTPNEQRLFPGISFRRYDELPELLEQTYGDENVNLNELAALCYTNKNRIGTNKMIRLLGFGDQEEPQVGDQVICLKNTRMTPVYNGMRGEITRIERESRAHRLVTIQAKEDEVEVVGACLLPQFNREKTYNDLDHVRVDTGMSIFRWEHAGLLLDYGYALTVHKAQGSQFKKVIVLNERPSHAADADMYGRWLYTAASRATTELIIVQ